MNCGCSFEHQTTCERSANTFYPPRARNRKNRHKIRRREFLIRTLKNFRSRTTDHYIPMHVVLSTLLSTFLPGAGLIYLDKKKDGCFTFVTFAICLALCIPTIKHPISNLLFIIAFLIWFIGIFYTYYIGRMRIRSSTPKIQKLIGSAIFTLGWILLLMTLLMVTFFSQISFPVMEYYIFPPYFNEGDRLIVSEISSDEKMQLTRGDWVVIDLQAIGNTLAVITGLPGESINYSPGKCIVNHQELDLSEYNIPYLKKPFEVIVAKDQYLVFCVIYQADLVRQMDRTIDSTNSGSVCLYSGTPYLIRSQNLESKIIATLSPSRHRRIW